MNIDPLFHLLVWLNLKIVGAILVWEWHSFGYAFHLLFMEKMSVTCKDLS